MFIPKTKRGVPIIGTLEILEGTALILGAELPADGQPAELKYAGETDVNWDSQMSKTCDGHRIFICEQGEEHLEPDIVWEPEKAVSAARIFVVVGHRPDSDQNIVSVTARNPQEAEQAFRIWLGESYPFPELIHVDAVLESTAPIRLCFPVGGTSESLLHIPNKL